MSDFEISLAVKKEVCKWLAWDSLDFFLLSELNFMIKDDNQIILNVSFYVFSSATFHFLRIK